MLLTKSVTSEIGKDDGLRLLVTRFRGRGLSKDLYDVWMASLGPSENLLAEFRQQEITWGEFMRRYREELWADSEVDEGNETIKNRGQKFTLRLVKHLSERENVTLLCHCADDEAHCHRHVLKDLIESAKV